LLDQVESTSPADRLHKQTLQAIGSVTDYGAGHIWAAENDKDPKLLMERVRTWRVKLPKSIADYAELLDALGFDVVIIRKPLSRTGVVPHGREVEKQQRAFRN
jgi:hypothetical protein